MRPLAYYWVNTINFTIYTSVNTYILVYLKCEATILTVRMDMSFDIPPSEWDEIGKAACIISLFK